MADAAPRRRKKVQAIVKLQIRAGQATPLERDMLFEQNRETGLLDKLGSFVSNLRQPQAPVVEALSEEEIDRRAEEKAEAMLEKIDRLYGRWLRAKGLHAV